MLHVFFKLIFVVSNICLLPTIVLVVDDFNSQQSEKSSLTTSEFVDGLLHAHNGNDDLEIQSFAWVDIYRLRNDLADFYSTISSPDLIKETNEEGCWFGAGDGLSSPLSSAMTTSDSLGCATIVPFHKKVASRQPGSMVHVIMACQLLAIKILKLKMQNPQRPIVLVGLDYYGSQIANGASRLLYNPGALNKEFASIAVSCIVLSTLITKGLAAYVEAKRVANELSDKIVECKQEFIKDLHALGFYSQMLNYDIAWWDQAMKQMQVYYMASNVPPTVNRGPCIDTIYSIEADFGPGQLLPNLQEVKHYINIYSTGFYSLNSRKPKFLASTQIPRKPVFDVAQLPEAEQLLANSKIINVRLDSTGAKPWRSVMPYLARNILSIRPWQYGSYQDGAFILVEDGDRLCFDSNYKLSYYQQFNTSRCCACLAFLYKGLIRKICRLGDGYESV